MISTIQCRITAAAYRTPEPRPRTPFPKNWQVPRRISTLCRALLECAAETIEAAGLRPEDTATLPVVFASRYAEYYRTIQLLQEWKEYGDLSPAGFALSVHNAPASLLSMAMGGHGSFSTVAAGVSTLPMGMLEASLYASAQGRCLFLYADHTAPGEETCLAAAALLEPGADELPLPRDFREMTDLCKSARP